MNAKVSRNMIPGPVISDTATKVRSLIEEARYALIQNDQPGVIDVLNRVDGLMEDLQRRSSVFDSNPGVRIDKPQL
jgi:hypothetical protein